MGVCGVVIWAGKYVHECSATRAACGEVSPSDSFDDCVEYRRYDSYIGSFSEPTGCSKHLAASTSGLHSPPSSASNVTNSVRPTSDARSQCIDNNVKFLGYNPYVGSFVEPTACPKSAASSSSASTPSVVVAAGHQLTHALALIQRPCFSPALSSYPTEE
ncbi:hypothetical protein FBULB1_14294 [Fusarium bulbicola]|nr:hypothetical protein FBULB1_14294 [Fusarium bulbicola]